MRIWDQQGCAICRQVMVSASYPADLPVSIPRHGRFYRCGACQTPWEIGERSAYEITEAEAAEYGFDS